MTNKILAILISITGLTTAHAVDYNGDGKPDYLLYNATTRQTAIWYLNNNVFIGGAYGPTIPYNWEPVAAADFNLDGNTDLVLFNTSTRQTAIWYLSGMNYIRGVYGPTIVPGYFLNSVADFNGDGHPDYVLYNPGTNRTAIWYLNNNVFIGGAYGPTISSGYTLCEIGDYNGDFQPDYVLDPPLASVLWYLHGTGLAGGAYGPVIPAPWKLASVSEARPCETSLAPAGLNLSTPALASSSFNVLASTSSCHWEPATTSDSSWILITYGGRGIGTDIVTFTVTASTDQNARTGSIDVAGKVFLITQAGTLNSEFAGTWLGTYTRQWSGAGCTYTSLTGVEFIINQNGTVIGGTGEVNGLPCWDPSTCSLYELAPTSGTIEGAVTGQQITVSYSGSYDSGHCSGEGFSETYTGNLSNATTLLLSDADGYQITLYKQP